MPTSHNMQRTGRRIQLLEKRVREYARRHRLASIEKISEKFEISNIEAYRIISDNGQHSARAIVAARSIDKLKKERDQLLQDLNEIARKRRK